MPIFFGGVLWKALFVLDHLVHALPRRSGCPTIRVSFSDIIKGLGSGCDSYWTGIWSWIEKGKEGLDGG